MKDFINFTSQYKIQFLLCAIFVFLDFLCGVVIALINHKYSSNKCRKGFKKVIGYLVIKICLLFICFVSQEIKSILSIYCYTIIFIEFTSIIETFKPYLPKQVIKVLDNFLESEKEKENKGSGDNG